MVKSFDARFDILSTIIFDVSSGDQQIDIQQRLDLYEPRADGRVIKRSKSNIMTTKKGFSDRLKEFVGLLKK